MEEGRGEIVDRLRTSSKSTSRSSRPCSRRQRRYWAVSKGIRRLRAEKTNQPGREGVKGLYRARPAPFLEEIGTALSQVGLYRGRELGRAVLALLRQRFVQLESKGGSEARHIPRGPIGFVGSFRGACCGGRQ